MIDLEKRQELNTLQTDLTQWILNHPEAEGVDILHTLLDAAARQTVAVRPDTDISRGIAENFFTRCTGYYAAFHAVSAARC